MEQADTRQATEIEKEENKSVRPTSITHGSAEIMKRQTNRGSSSKRDQGRKDESGTDEQTSARGTMAKACAGQCQRGQHAKVTNSMEQWRQARMRPRKAGKETRQEALKSRCAR